MHNFLDTLAVAMRMPQVDPVVAAVFRDFGQALLEPEPPTPEPSFRSIPSHDTSRRGRDPHGRS